ncbi:unnamed protein product, partial [Prorocentrum cordatum]
MVLGNALLESPVGEASLLAASASWVPLHTPEGKWLLLTGDDQKGTFCVWRVPKAWHPYMAIGRSLAGALFGRPERQVYIAPEVMAMGWMLAAPIFQHIHCRLCRLPPPRGAGLPPEAEWQKDEARPIVELGSGCEAGWWQVYIDDFDVPETVDEVRARQLGGTEAHLRETRVERMGAGVDGVSGRLAAPRPKYNAEMVEELFTGLMLLPAAATSLRARVEGMVTVSDASEFGGGVCASTSPRGEAALALKSVRQVVDHLGAGTRLLNMPVEPRCPWTVSNPRLPKAVVFKVLTVLVGGGLFDDGIGGLAVSLSKLPARIVADVTAETDAKARRVVQLRWPGAIGGGGVARGGEGLLQDLFDMFSGTVDAAAAGTGGPRQGLSRLDASGGGLHGRRGSLCYEVPWRFWLLRQTFGRRFYSLLENAVAPPLRFVDKGRYLEVMADTGPLLDIE